MLFGEFFSFFLKVIEILLKFVFQFFSSFLSFVLERLSLLFQNIKNERSFCSEFSLWNNEFFSILFSFFFNFISLILEFFLLFFSKLGQNLFNFSTNLLNFYTLEITRLLLKNQIGESNIFEWSNEFLFIFINDLSLLLSHFFSFFLVRCLLFSR